MARLGSDNNVRESVVILSSDDEDDSSNNQGRRDNANPADGYPDSSGQMNQYRGIPHEFMRVIKKLREHLREEKDDRRCNILGLMYRKASETLTTSQNFKNFIKDIMVELEKSKNDRANILLLLTALCQTLAVGEIMWSPANENKSKSKTKTNAQSSNSKGALQKETREQCNAVKALLFNDSPPPRPPELASTLKNKDKENGERRLRVLTETKEKEKVEKKTGKKQITNNKPKNKNVSKSSISEVAEVKGNERSERRSTRGSRRNSTATSKKKDDSRSPSSSPPIIIPAPRDPLLTDLSSEAVNSMVPSSIDIISTKDQEIPDNPSPEETSNVIVLGDFDVDTIDNEEVEDVISCSNNTGRSSTQNNSPKKSKPSLVDVVAELSSKGKSSPKPLLEAESKKGSSASGKNSKFSLLEIDVTSHSGKSSNREGTQKSSLLLSTNVKSTPSSSTSVKNTPPPKDVKKPTDAKKTKKSDKSSATLKKGNDKNTKRMKEGEKSSSPLTSPILSPTSRRSTFLKAVEKVKKDVLLESGKKAEKEFDEMCEPKSMEKRDPLTVQSSNSEKGKTVKSAKRKKKEETKQAKGSKPSSEDSSDDEVLFISEKPPIQKSCSNNTVETSPNVTATNQAHSRNIPYPQLSAPKVPWVAPGVKKTPGQSLLDMCYVYELQVGGGVVPSPLVNNSLQPNLQTSALSSRETSRYLESGPQGTISVVTPSKAYTTSVNTCGRTQVGQSPAAGNPNYTSEVVTMVDGSIMSIERSDQVGKRSYPSEKSNSSDVQVIPDDDICEMTPMVTLSSDAFLSGNKSCTPSSSVTTTTISGKCPQNKQTHVSWINTSGTCKLHGADASSESCVVDANTSSSRRKSPPTTGDATCNKNKSDISTSCAKTAKESSPKTSIDDITVILDSNSSNEGSDNEENMQDEAPKNTKDNKMASNKGTKETDDINATASPVNDEVISDSMLHEKEISSVGDCDMTSDKTEMISNEGKNESAGDSSEDEVTVVSDPTILDENSSKEKSPFSTTSNKECETITDDDDAKVETPDESSGDEVTITSDAGGDSDGKHSEGNDLLPEFSKEKSTSNEATESTDGSTKGKSPSESESSGDEVTVLSDSDEMAEDKSESDEGKSTVPDVCSKEAVVSKEKKKESLMSKEATKLSENDVNGEDSSEVTAVCDTACTLNTEKGDDNELGSAVSKSKVRNESLAQNQTAKSDVDLNSLITDNTKESVKTTKSNGKKSISDIANKLKQQMEKKKTSNDSSASNSTVSSSTPTPTVSSTVSSPSERLHLFCSNKFKRLLSSHHSHGTIPPIANQNPGEVILIGDDSDEEETEPASNKVVSASSKKQPVTSKSSAPKGNPTSNKAPVATSNNESPVVTRPSITKPPVSNNKKVVSVSCKKQSADSNKPVVDNGKMNTDSKTIVPIQKNCTEKKKVSSSTIAKPTYVSNILSDRTKETAKPFSSRILGAAGAEKTKQSSSDCSKTTVSDSNEDDDFTTSLPQGAGEVTKKLSKKEKIKKLEIILERLERKINRFARQELGYRDLASEGSAYLQEARAKERFLHHWRIYCTLIGEDADLVVSSRKKVKVTSSPFSPLNAAVEKYINKSDIFPNLFEVKQCCTQANIKYNLDLKENDLHNCAVDIFSEVGRKLQKRREKDFRNTSGNVLTDEVKMEDDPARRDMDLKQKLKLNKKIAKQRTDNVFKDFVRQQYEQTTGVTDKSDDSGSERLVSDNERPLTCSDSDTQGSAGGAENSDSDEDSDNDVPLEQIRRENEKRRLSSDKGAEKPVAKKKRVDKTVISLTLSSSQEIQETSSGNNKIDYQVTIGSSKPTVIKSIQNKNINESRSKSPSSLLHQVVQGHQTKQLQKHARKLSQSKVKSLKLIKPPTKRQLSTDISTETPSTVKPKDKIPKLNNHNNLSSGSCTEKQKRISLANDNVAGNYAGFESSESNPGKEKGKVFDKPFPTKKIRPTLLPAKPVLGAGAQKKAVVPAEYVPLSVFSNMNGDKGKDDNSLRSKERMSKSKLERETIVLDDD